MVIAIAIIIEINRYLLAYYWVAYELIDHTSIFLDNYFCFAE